MTTDILHELRRINCDLVLVQPEKKTFLVKPKTNNDVLDHKIRLNAGRILQQLIDSDALVTAIETWTKDDPKRWQLFYTKFRKDYAPVPYIEDAYDDLISWLNANQKITSARQKISQLQKRKNKSYADKISIDARYADISAYQRNAVRRRGRLVTNLLSLPDLYGQITKFMSKHGTKKETIATS